MTDRRRPAHFNVWKNEQGDVVIDLFTEPGEGETPERDDAEVGIVLHAYLAQMLAAEIRSLS